MFINVTLLIIEVFIPILFSSPRTPKALKEGIINFILSPSFINFILYCNPGIKSSLSTIYYLTPINSFEYKI